MNRKSRRDRLLTAYMAYQKGRLLRAQWHTIWQQRNLQAAGHLDDKIMQSDSDAKSSLDSLLTTGSDSESQEDSNMSNGSDLTFAAGLVDFDLGIGRSSSRKGTGAAKLNQIYFLSPIRSHPSESSFRIVETPPEVFRRFTFVSLSHDPLHPNVTLESCPGSPTETPLKRP